MMLLSFISAFSIAQIVWCTVGNLQPRYPKGTARIWTVMSADLVDHYYSTNVTEARFLIDFYGFSVEGPKGTSTGYIYTDERPGTVPLFRLYSIGRTDHFLTASPQERDHAIKRQGYHLEGILGYIHTSIGPGLVPFFRLHNVNAHDHYYTSSEYEREDAARNGWEKEGAVGYVFELEDDTPLLTTMTTLTSQE